MWLLWVNSVAVWVTGGAVVLFMTYLLASRLVKQRRHVSEGLVSQCTLAGGFLPAGVSWEAVKCYSSWEGGYSSVLG